MDSHTGPSLEQLVEDLALKICVENEVFKDVFTAVCQGMGWESKSQRDVTKLFMLCDFKTLLQRFGIVSEFQIKTHKTCGSCRANCIAFNQKQSVVPLAIGQNICDGPPLSAHLHSELNSTYSSTCDNCMSESSLKKGNIFSTAHDVLSIILLRYGDGEKKHEACHSRQDVDREKQTRTGLLYVEKRCGSPD